MNILVLNYEMPPVGGGGKVASLKLSEAWAQAHCVDYVTSATPGLPRRENISGVNVIRVPVVGRRSLSRASLPSLLSYPVSGLLPALELCRSRQYDIVNTHFAIPSGPLGLAVAATRGLAHVVSVYCGDVYHPRRRSSPRHCFATRWIVREVLSRADAVVAGSAGVELHTLRNYGFDLRPRLHTVPLPFDPPPREWLTEERADARVQLGLDPKAFYLVSVGRMVAGKRYHGLIRSLLHLSRSVRLIIVGDGPLRGQLGRLAEREGLLGRVLFTGLVDERHRYRYLRAADLYLLSSHHEGFGNVLHEAMAAGLPIVATGGGGNTDLIQDGKNARLIESNDEGCLAEAVRELLERPALRHAMCQENLRLLGRYACGNIAARYLEVFRQSSGTYAGNQQRAAKPMRRRQWANS